MVTFNVVLDCKCWLMTTLTGALCPQAFCARTESVPDTKLGEKIKLMFVPVLEPVAPDGVVQT